MKYRSLVTAMIVEVADLSLPKFGLSSPDRWLESEFVGGLVANECRYATKREWVAETNAVVRGRERWC